MSNYSQLVTPNPNVPGEHGMCLLYVQTAFGAPVTDRTAHDAYVDAGYKHSGIPPTDICVPIWFSMTANPDWHVALWDKGAVYSVSDKGVQNFGSIANLLNYMNNGTVNEGMVYLGWSEDIETLRVVKGEDMTVDDTLARRLYSLSTLMAQDGTAPDRQPTTKEIQDAVGKDAVAFCDYLMSTVPWGGNWNKVKHYDEDVKNAANSSYVAYTGPQLYTKKGS